MIVFNYRTDKETMCIKMDRICEKEVLFRKSLNKIVSFVNT